MKQATELIKAIGSLAWPAIAGVVLWRLFPLIKRVLESRGFSVKFGQMEISVQEASDQFMKQLKDVQDKIVSLHLPPPEMPAVATAAPSKGAFARRILWVDDNPSNNAFEIAKLRGDHIEVDLARSTAEAMQILTADYSRFDAIISDMGRYESSRYQPSAGIDLISAVRAAGVSVPIFVYSSPATATKKYQEVLKAGGNGATGSPTDLFRLIQGAYARAATGA
jgi:CheY-like chemotaxis protein